MSPSRAPSKALLRQLRAIAIRQSPSRAFSSTITTTQELQSISQTPPPDPATVATIKEEWELFKAGTPPIGSRRRRLALQQTAGIPFDELPYQCFQEARKILIADRAEKLQKIETEGARIERLRSTDPKDISGGERAKQKRLKSMSVYLEESKVLADINDPNVKRRFEDGIGDMNKPVYRHLARKKWEEYRRKIQVQRIQTMKVVPDVVPRCDPIVDITLAFGRNTITPGEFVNSSVSESPPRMKIQSFDRGEKLFTVAVVDPDVPNIQTDTFDSRCHFLATNISITPTNPYFDLCKLRDEQIMLPWIPPTSLKGSPYHRISIILLQHKDNVPVDREATMANLNREDFSTRSLMTRHMLNPIGATLFRVKWDDTMAAVMNRHNIPGANVELKRQKVEPLPYQRRRGNFR